MNRRHFLSSLAALPFVGILVKAEDVRPESTLPLTFDKMTMYKDKYQIFTPAEISRRWVYVSTPCFMVGDTGYAVGTWKLKLMLREGLVGTEYGRYGAQQIASTEINRLGLTHVHAVEFFSSPIIHPLQEEPCYCAYVRGAKV